MCPTKFEKRLLEALGPNKEGFDIVNEKIGVTRNARNVTLTRIYKRFNDDLELLIKYYPLFERRFKHDEPAYSELRKLARLIRKE